MNNQDTSNKELCEKLKSAQKEIESLKSALKTTEKSNVALQCIEDDRTDETVDNRITNMLTPTNLQGESP